jgi:predicted nuclease of predicted toxin-antitoxin system
MRLLLDMNLSPEWIAVLRADGWDAIHWSTVGAPTAPDLAIMAWASEHGWTVLTNDLDFSTILATTRAAGPSVVQVRGQDLAPAVLAPTLLAVLRTHREALDAGAILTLDLQRARVRALPLG